MFSTLDESGQQWFLEKYGEINWGSAIEGAAALK
jgi:hypothetical protein